MPSKQNSNSKNNPVKDSQLELSKRPSIIALARQEFHRLLLSGTLTVDKKGIPNFADRDSDASIAIARGIVRRIGQATTQVKEAGQTSGKKFETSVADFLKASFSQLSHLRPGKWEIRDRRSTASVEISNFEQYEHLAKLMSIIESDPDISSALGSDYLITPDVIVLRRPETEDAVNRSKLIADESIARLTPLRKLNRPNIKTKLKGQELEHEILILHASVSCKWTIRSDRAQNARSEALNLIRNRKGRVPHIVAITAEPLPSRLASLALGTSDLDCVYHIALKELSESVADMSTTGRSDQQKVLTTLVNGKRLRDIGDLPFDLAI